MTAARVGQIVVEAFLTPTEPKARIGQVSLEAFLAPTDQKAKIGQVSLEAFLTPTTPKARVGQLFVEAFLTELPAVFARVGQVSLEAMLMPDEVFARLGQIVVEVFVEEREIGVIYSFQTDGVIIVNGVAVDNVVGATVTVTDGREYSDITVAGEGGESELQGIDSILKVEIEVELYDEEGLPTDLSDFKQYRMNDGVTNNMEVRIRPEGTGSRLPEHIFTGCQLVESKADDDSGEANPPTSGMLKWAVRLSTIPLWTRQP
jgi:hypothetical protein